VVDGSVSRRFVINNGEAAQTGQITYGGNGAATYQFELQAYLDSSNQFYQIIDNDPANAGSFS